jgi:hypothetical protein
MVQPMTSIQPKPCIPLGAGAPAAPPDSQRSREETFAAFLAGEEAGQSRIFPGESRQADLEAGLAHVFNAFGFFQAGPQPPPGNPNRRAGDMRLRAPQMPRELPETAEPEEPTCIVRKICDVSAPPVVNGPQTRLAAEGTAGQDLTPGRSVIGEMFESKPAAVRQTDAGPGPPRSILPAPICRASSQSEIESQSSEFRRTEDCGEQARKPPPRVGANDAAETSDHLIFRVGSHEVELIGRLANLDGQEERRLMDELAALLDGHGLTLSGATLNGRVIGLNGFGRTS